MDINPEDETSCTTQYQGAFLTFVEIEYCLKHRCVAVNKLESLPSSNLIPSPTASGSCQSSFDPDDSSSNDDEYLTPNNVAETTPGQCDCAPRLLTPAMLYYNWPPETPKNQGQIISELNEYHSDPMEIRSTFCLRDITDSWHQQKETPSRYAEFSNVACELFSIIPDGVGVKASFSLGGDFIAWWTSKTTGKTLCEKFGVRKVAPVNYGILAAADPLMDTTNTEDNSEMKKESEEWKWHRKAKVHDCFEMWQGTQNFHAT